METLRYSIRGMSGQDGNAALDSREHVQMDIDRLDFPSKKADKAEL